jgi:hypothetical protein
VYLVAKKKSLPQVLQPEAVSVLIELFYIVYGSEAWVLNKVDDNMINILERKILRKIFGAVRENETTGEHGTIMNCTGYTENKT